eukprot:scaffold2738_cov366-Prasinococcus_capsulatus_cf.AAC.5
MPYFQKVEGQASVVHVAIRLAVSMIFQGAPVSASVGWEGSSTVLPVTYYFVARNFLPCRGSIDLFSQQGANFLWEGVQASCLRFRMQKLYCLVEFFKAVRTDSLHNLCPLVEERNKFI